MDHLTLLLEAAEEARKFGSCVEEPNHPSDRRQHDRGTSRRCTAMVRSSKDVESQALSSRIQALRENDGAKETRMRSPTTSSGYRGISQLYCESS